MYLSKHTLAIVALYMSFIARGTAHGNRPFTTIVSTANSAPVGQSSSAPVGQSSDLPIPQDPGTSGHKDFGNGLIYESENFHGLSSLCKSPYISRDQCVQAYSNLYDDLVYPPAFRQKGSANMQWYCELKFEGDAQLPGEYAKEL